MTEKGICPFYSRNWNNPEKKEYLICECSNPNNIGGKRAWFNKKGILLDVSHKRNMYSSQWENEKMAYRCWGSSNKMKECPLIKSISS